MTHLFDVGWLSLTLMDFSVVVEICSNVNNRDKVKADENINISLNVVKTCWTTKQKTFSWIPGRYLLRIFLQFWFESHCIWHIFETVFKKTYRTRLGVGWTWEILLKSEKPVSSRKRKKKSLFFCMKFNHYPRTLLALCDFSKRLCFHIHIRF